MKLAEEYVGRRFDGVWDSELRRELGGLSEMERLDFFARVLVLQQERGLSMGPWFKLVEATLREKSSFSRLLQLGLVSGDASTIRPWLEVAARRLGCRAVIRILREEEHSHPSGVALTHYWLPSLAQSPSERRMIAEYLSRE